MRRGASDHEAIEGRPPAAGLALAAGLVLAAGLALGGCGAQEASESETAAAEEAAGGPGSPGRTVNVEVEEVSTSSFTRTVRITGTAEANRDVRVSAEESGVIRELPVDQGARVREGQMVARIDDRVLRAQVEQARAQAELARENWERRKRLYEQDQAISELDYLRARYEAEEASARLRSLEERLARTRIEAPLGGILEERYVEVGTLVSSGTPVARIIDVDPVEIAGGVPERYAPEIETGAPATVRFDVLPDTSFDARLSFVGSSVDPENRTFRVELSLPNPGGVIKPEMVANVEVVRGTLPEAVVVPQGALVRREEGFVAFVVEPASGAATGAGPGVGAAAEAGGKAEAGGDGALVARARPVETGASRDGRVVIRSGLEPGDRLVVVGQGQVADGDRVRVVGGGA